MTMEPITYPSEVFSRLVPDLYLHRHLNQGVRPATDRSFTQHRKINSFLGGLKKPVGEESASSTLVWGSSLIQADGMSIVCGITGSVSEEEGGIFTNVEILRGANGSSAAMGGPPSDEEQVVSRKSCDLLRKGIFNTPESKQFFELKNFLKEGQQDEAIFDAGQHQKRYLCLHANVTVVSRNGPVQDYVWAAVLAALKDTKIPLMDIDEDTGRISLTKEHTTIPVEDLKIDSSRSFGFVKPKQEAVYDDDEMDTSEDISCVLLADVQGEVEQAATSSTREGSRLQIVRGRGDKLIGFSFVGKGTGVGINELKDALDLSKQE